MTAFYDALINASNRLLADKGQTVTLVQVAEGTYDPATSSATNTETQYYVKGALLPYKQQAIASDALIQKGDMKLLVSPLTTVGGALPIISPQDKVIINSVTWVIVSVKPIYPNGQLVLQELQIRK